MFRNALTATVLLSAFLAHAKTPGEIYEQAAKSTVVVQNIDSAGIAKSMGSGVILPDRDVVTNCHVVKGASQLNVRIGKNVYPASLRYSDWDRDVCSLSVSGINSPAVVIGSTKSLKVGAKVYAIGAPKGLELTLSDGIVSSLREVEGGRYIQTTAAISPGSSGGGLFDENGALVGLTTFYLAEGQSLNFAVPIEWIQELPKRSVKSLPQVQSETQWLNKAIELESRENWSALIKHCISWSQAQPNSVSAWYGLGKAYGKTGQSAKAIEAYQQQLRVNPEDAVTWYSLGNAYDKTGQSAKAIEAYQQSLRINPEDADAWYNLSIAYDKSNQPAKAIEAYQQSLRINPEDAGAWYNLGIAYHNSNQAAKAAEALQQALRINPENANAWFSLGMAYGRTNQPPKAIEAFQQALRIAPKHTDAWFGLGFAYKITGQSSKVMDVYRRLKVIDPQRAEEFFSKFVLPQ